MLPVAVDITAAPRTMRDSVDKVMGWSQRDFHPAVCEAFTRDVWYDFACVLVTDGACAGEREDGSALRDLV